MTRFGGALLWATLILGPAPPVLAEGPTRVYWGDTHVHTQLSADAFPLGTRLTPDDAYRFAKGEKVLATGGQEVQLRRPLDFLMISDHAENLGVLPRLVSDDSFLAGDETSEAWRDTLRSLAPIREVLNADSFEEYSAGMLPLFGAKKAMNGEYPLSMFFQESVWQAVGEVAERHYDPGMFTTFTGYEWTGSDGAMIHRNVLFADGPEVTDQTLPFSANDSNDVEDLWAYLSRYESEFGGSAISIPHNGNLSKGAMFALRTFSGGPLSQAYARERARWEPIYEVTQIKGDGETHPLLSQDDEHADFETWPPPIFGGASGEETGSYARSALKMGLQQQEKFATNPFKFGMIGSTDSHTALATADEDLFLGKMSLQEPSRYRAIDQWYYSASGYAAVWAEENTRESLFAAMKRKETYATTGPRMVVRFFAGWEFDAKDIDAEDPATIGYAKGVPMGGDLRSAPQGRPPTFLAYAMKDPDGADLDRVQIIKGWHDADGGLHEQVFDVAKSADQNGAELATVWTDPNFDENEAAFYYARVIEVATPRWTAIDAIRYEIDELPDEVPMTVQERAYTSPIWYTP